MREMRYRQRNIVFPETAMNWGRFWRNLNSRKYPFTLGQKVCFAVLVIVLVPPLLAWFVGTIIQLVAQESVLFDWIANAPTLGIFILDAVLLFRACIAVFGDTTFPELPVSARRNMLGQNGSRLYRHR